MLTTKKTTHLLMFSQKNANIPKLCSLFAHEEISNYGTHLKTFCRFFVFVFFEDELPIQILYDYVMSYLPLEDVWKLKHINDKLGEKLEQYKCDEEIFVEFLDQREQYNFEDFNTKNFMLRFPYEDDYASNNFFLFYYSNKILTPDLRLSFQTFDNDNDKGVSFTFRKTVNYLSVTFCKPTNEFPNPFFNIHFFPQENTFRVICNGQLQHQSGVESWLAGIFYTDFIYFPRGGNQILRRKTLETLKFD